MALKASTFWIAALLGVTMAACSNEGSEPRQAVIDPDGDAQAVAIHHLKNLEDPYSDWFIAAETGLYTEFGALKSLVDCSERGFVCVADPFAFSFPREGRPSMAGWTAGGYEFVARYEVERDFCGQSREVWLIDGVAQSGLMTRTWYHPDFGIYAVLIGQAEDGQMVRIERAYQTCERGLYARRSFAPVPAEDDARS